MRALVLYTATWQDDVMLAEHAGETDTDAYRLANAVNDLLLPIVKGYGSERSWVLLGTESLQTFGGSGFLQEYPLEQYVRDAKIDTLYEGTTAIQGQDFFFRKIVKDQGRALGHLAAQIKELVEDENGNARLKNERALLGTALEDANALVGHMINDLMSAESDVRNLYKVGLNTSRLLMVLGDVVCGWLLLRQAEVALAKLDGARLAVGQGQGLLRGQGRRGAVLRAVQPAEDQRRARHRRGHRPLGHGPPRGRLLRLAPRSHRTTPVSSARRGSSASSDAPRRAEPWCRTVESTSTSPPVAPDARGSERLVLADPGRRPAGDVGGLSVARTPLGPSRVPVHLPRPARRYGVGRRPRSRRVARRDAERGRTPGSATIGMELAFAMGTLQWLLALVVLGVGALVLAYCAWYFRDDSLGVPRFAGVLTAFVGAMLGLVLADDLLLLYVFWELTTVFSFLLIGHDPARRASRQAAIQALMVTTLGGLAMLVGVLLLGHAGRHPPDHRDPRRPAVAAPPSPSRSSCSWSARSASPRWCRSTSGCPPRWPRPPRSAPTCTPPRW